MRTRPWRCPRRRGRIRSRPWGPWGRIWPRPWHPWGRIRPSVWPRGGGKVSCRLPEGWGRRGPHRAVWISPPGVDCYIAYHIVFVKRAALCELAQSPFLPFGLHFDVGRAARTEVLGGDRSIDAGSSTSDCDEDSNGRESHGSRELRG